MFEFGRELRRILGSGVGRDGRADPSLLELLDLPLLDGQGRAAATAAGRVSTRKPLPFHFEACALWREYARRTGCIAALGRADQAALAALADAGGPAERARAALEAALTDIVAADLFGDAARAASAKARLEAAAGADDPAVDARVEAAYARLASREALAASDYPRALEAAALFDSAVHKLETVDPDQTAGRLEAVAARLERADLLAGFGVQMRDKRLLEGAARDLSALVDRLDPDYEPLTWARAAELCGTTLAALGESCGRSELIAEGVSTLAEIGERFTRDHSPLDWVRWKLALGQAVQLLAEACDSDAAFEQAGVCFEEALEACEASPDLVLRAVIGNNRAACLARRAERGGDLEALAEAEAAFKVELASVDPRLDPVGWAVVQVNLARLYEARGDLTGVFAQRASALYALETALEVFLDHGLKGLAEQALDGLDRVRAA